MGSVNRITLVGNLGQKPELRVTSPAGTSVCNFSLATNHGHKKDTGERVETVEWHRVVAWGALADVCAKHLEQGSSVYVEGRMTYREWVDKEGKAQLSPEVIATDVQFLSKRSVAQPSAVAQAAEG